ncbi:hypothetical protein LXL04_024456 [Taraxacum kok-saghyz]
MNGEIPHGYVPELGVELQGSGLGVVTEDGLKVEPDFAGCCIGGVGGSDQALGYETHPRSVNTLAVTSGGWRRLAAAMGGRRWPVAEGGCSTRREVYEWKTYSSYSSDPMSLTSSSLWELSQDPMELNNQFNNRGSNSIFKDMASDIQRYERTRNTLWIRGGLFSPYGKHPAISCSRCLGAVPLEMAGVATCIAGPAGACVVGRSCSCWCSFAITGNVPLLFAVSAIEFPAFAVVMVVALVAFGEISLVLLLWRRVVGRCCCIDNNGVLLFLWCLRGALLVVVVIVVVVVVPKLSFWLILAGLSFWGQCPLPDCLISQAYCHALGVFKRQWIESSN